MCMNNSMCGCSSNNNECENFGPFVAVDAACITTPAPTTGSIIAYSSGVTPVILVSAISGLITTVSLVGFGTAVPGITLAGINIDLTAVGATEAFTVPRPGTITSISATIASTVVLAVAGTATVRAQIYRAVPGSNVFSPTAAFVDLLPSLPLLSIIAGTIASGNADVSVPVNTGDRLLMVFSMTTTGATAITTFAGNASAGINIV
ncbi:exosporium glycoprotein BclB-related protein [Lysinibacillus sp. NPDC056959]|uniref:exosporium glycoprotein BclB-related protein n=1 Tax=Lysinibacillus sp. NPDC056959 TaxID=3345981 RepID=UPI00363ECE28